MNFLSCIGKRHDAVPFRLRVTSLAIVRMSFFALLSVSLFGARQALAQDSIQIHWKPADMAQVRLDGKTPIKWNVYQPDKKDKKDKKRDSDLILVLLGHRFLMLDVREHAAYVVPLTAIH
jgi:hypothetical protein